MDNFYKKINIKQKKYNRIKNNDLFNNENNNELNNQNNQYLNINNNGEIKIEDNNNKNNNNIINIKNNIANNINHDNNINNIPENTYSDINHNNSDYDNNLKNIKSEGNGRLPGGGNDDIKNPKNLEDDKEGNEEDERDSNNNSNDEVDTYNEYNNNENSYLEIDKDNISIETDKNNSSYNSKKSKFIIEEESEDENDIILNGNEKDDNVDRIQIIWNKKFMKDINKLDDINLIDICESIYKKSKNQKISIEKCFEEFSKEEKLDINNLWKCQNCNKNLQAKKKIELYNIPKILIIHLKRFNNNKKINSLIEFPLTNLDLNKYINKNNSNKNQSKYDLFGVINHFGSMEYGHYTSFCKNNHDNLWYEYNDRIVNNIQSGKEKEIIINPNAYILFYREQNNDIIKWENIYNKKYEEIIDNNLKKFDEDFIYDEPKEIIKIIEKEDKNKVINKTDINIEIDTDKKINEVNKDIIMSNSETIQEKKNNVNENFSFKEGVNNYIEINKNINNNTFDLNESQTSKFKKHINVNIVKEENQKNKNNFNFPKDKEDKKDNLIEINNINNNINNKFQTQFKEKYIDSNVSKYSTITKLDNNVIRIKTFKKISKNKNKKINVLSNNKNIENNLEKKYFVNNPSNNIKNKSHSSNYDLLQYDIFNQNKNYFKIDLKQLKPSLKSVRNKELSNFLLKEYSDDISDKIPRSKKLYNDSNLNTESKVNNNNIFNNHIKNKDEKNEEKIIAIKEEDNQNIKYVNKNEFDLEDFVYNPFRDCFTKLRKYEQ